MKYNNESIDRLDGDIYETCTGQLIDMSMVFSIRGGINCGVWPSFSVFIGHDYMEINYHYSGGFNSTEDEREVEQRRLEFIEVWKHLKRENERI